MGRRLATTGSVPWLRPGHLVPDSREGRAPGQDDLRRMSGHRTMPVVGDLLRRTLWDMGRPDRQRTPAGTPRHPRAVLSRMWYESRLLEPGTGPVPLVSTLAAQTAPKGHLVAVDDDTPKKAQKGPFRPVFCKARNLRYPVLRPFFPPKTARKGCVLLRLPGSPPSAVRTAA